MTLFVVDGFLRPTTIEAVAGHRDFPAPPRRARFRRLKRHWLGKAEKAEWLHNRFVMKTPLVTKQAAMKRRQENARMRAYDDELLYEQSYQHEQWYGARWAKAAIERRRYYENRELSAEDIEALRKSMRASVPDKKRVISINLL